MLQVLRYLIDSANASEKHGEPEREIEGVLPLLLTVCTCCKATFVLMILPQVHLRKPCYDFYFL